MLTTVQNAWVQSQKWQNDLCLFPRQTIQYHSNSSLCPNHWHGRSWSWMVVYEGLQDLLELTPKKDILFIIGYWNAKVESQDIPGSVQFSRSVVSNSAIPWIAARQASLSITSSRSSLKLMSIESVMPSSHLILCHPLLLLLPIPPSIRVFSNESTLHMRWPKYWSFSFSIGPCNEHPGLISFRRDWLDLLAVQGTLKSLLQHHSSKASILRHSAFFIVQISHPYMTTGKTTALTRRTFVGKAMSLLFNILSRSVITFLPRSKHLLIPWLQSPLTTTYHVLRFLFSAATFKVSTHTWLCLESV